MDEKIDLNKVKLLLNSLNSLEGLYRHKQDKQDNNLQYYFRKSQETIWALLDEVESYRSKEE